jgi:hypothetical protein
MKRSTPQRIQDIKEQTVTRDIPVLKKKIDEISLEE